MTKNKNSAPEARNLNLKGRINSDLVGFGRIKFYRVPGGPSIRPKPDYAASLASYVKEHTLRDPKFETRSFEEDNPYYNLCPLIKLTMLSKSLPSLASPVQPLPITA
jgi:hypothetical protein